MKTLHKIFHKNIFKSYAWILIVSLVSLETVLLTYKISENSNFLSLMNVIAIFAAAAGPLAIFFCNNNFPHNVKFLINQHFNRSELFKFFFFSQTLKILLAVTNYLVLGFFLYMYNSNVKKILSVPELSHLFSTYFLLFILAMSCLYLFYSFALFGANRQDVQKIKAWNSVANKNKKRTLKSVFLFVFSLYVMLNYTIPDAIKGYLWCLFISFTSLTVFNRTFKLVHQRRSFQLAGLGSFIICMPLLGIFYGMRLEAKDPNIDFKTRAHTVTLLNWMNPDFSEEEMLGFLKEADNDNYSEILGLFGDRVDFESSLKLVDNSYRGKKFIDFHSRSYGEEKVKKIVSHMAKLMRDQKLDFSFAQNAHSFFIKQKVDDAYIERLIKSKSSFKQLASIYFAKNSYDKKKLLEFYKKNMTALDSAVVNDRYVRRSIASEHEAKGVR